MFTQDVQLAVMPIGGRTEKHKEFSVTLEGSQSEREEGGAIDWEKLLDTTEHDLAWGWSVMLWKK